MNETVINGQPAITKLDIGAAASGVTTGGGVMLWLADNSSAIGVIVAMTSLLITALFLFLNYRTNKEANRINRMNIEARLIKELKHRASPQQEKILEDLLW